METLSLDGRTALITGASSGIGTASAHALAREGVDLALAARREDRLDGIADEVESDHGVETLAVPTDVRDEEAVEAMVEETVERFGGLDILLNNAGLGRGGAVESLSTEDYRLMQETNVDGMFFATRAALPHLEESRGNLLFIGSFAGQYPRPSNPVYAATKWWTRGFAHSVEASVGDEGVAVTVINPTEVRTEFGSASGESFEERFEEGEVTEPEEIADAVVFAAGQRNSTVSELDLYRRDKFGHF
ncbi:SDR family oxidoreductase [Halalkalicoccus sp. NIPERK01]|uniref:SDR family oxidoreductase n=1 Tax=Halalkalicoccus sp. NIPERK01 TaxID=3053469 RepID=UPI00256F45D6|nr:SDR family oxidoreductase [Halalkalicoccus sp. NIPERK01]MDL5360962.1 SDR family oxidoreductase [Halalkalicoccus sp. NIPERK01]